jgi:hypothetical protein
MARDAGVFNFVKDERGMAFFALGIGMLTFELKAGVVMRKKRFVNCSLPTSGVVTGFAIDHKVIAMWILSMQLSQKSEYNRYEE